jgi:hypothetical protein
MSDDLGAAARDWVNERTDYPRYVAQLALAHEADGGVVNVDFDWRPKNNVSNYASTESTAITVWPIGWPCSHNFRSKAQTLASPQQRRLRIAARMGEPPTTMHGYELFQPPRYARLTSGMRASSAPVPESLTRPFSST